jgi:hypothetical protein
MRLARPIVLNPESRRQLEGNLWPGRCEKIDFLDPDNLHYEEIAPGCPLGD